MFLLFMGKKKISNSPRQVVEFVVWLFFFIMEIFPYFVIFFLFPQGSQGERVSTKKSLTVSYFGLIKLASWIDYLFFFFFVNLISTNPNCILGWTRTTGKWELPENVMVTKRYFQLSVDSNTWLFQYCLTTLCDWFKKYSYSTSQMRSENESRLGHVCVNPRLASVTCMCFECLLIRWVKCLCLQ